MMMQTYIGMGNVMKSTQCLSDIGRTHYLIICPPEYPFAPLQKNNILKGTFFCPFEFENRLFPSILGSCCKKTVNTADMEFVKFLTGVRFPIFQILPETRKLRHFWQKIENGGCLTPILFTNC